MKQLGLPINLACLTVLVSLLGCGPQLDEAGSGRIMIAPAVVGSGGIMATDYSDQVAATLKAAGENAPQLRKFLDHFSAVGDAQEKKAAEFLVANMSPHGFVEAGLFDGDGNAVHYDSLEYETFEDALVAREALEKKHKGLRTKRKRYLPDIKTLSAEYLIDQTDRAFDAWRTLPWAADVTFDAFCNYILPYRGSGEPAGQWRKPCREALAEVLSALEDPNDVRAVSQACSKHRGKWVHFNKKCYLHPTDQSFEDMMRTKLGRCEDLSNMKSYLNRANGVPMTSDYTPAWARGNNNHAWNALLDARGKAYPPNNPMLGAAKVYRKMFAMQPDLPAFHCASGERIPGWLAGKCYRDVTAQYRPTHDVTVSLTAAIPAKSTYAYLCVFNSGRWTAIAYGAIDKARHTATFRDIGGNIAYWPAYYVGKKLIPAGPVMTLATDGTVSLLDKPVVAGQDRIATPIRRMKDVDISPDTGKPIPAIKVAPGKKYELFYWDGKWESLGKRTAASAEPLKYDNLPAGRLYRLVETAGRGRERPFTIEAGKQILW